MELSNEQGAEQIIRDLRVLVDNKPVEEIQHYNILHKFKKDYMDDNSKSALDSTFNHAELNNAVSLANGYFNTSYNATTPAVAYDEVGQKQIVKMDCSGVLSLPVGFPVLATGKVGIEITLEDAERVLKPKGAFENVACNNANGTGQTTGGGNIASLDVLNTNDTTLEGLGFSNATNTQFAVGNTIRIRCNVAGGNNINELRLITAVANQGNTIRVSFANIAGGANNANVNNANISLLVGVDENGATRASQYDYEITEVEYVVRSIDMPPPYLQSLQRRIQQQAFMMDIPTYSSYLDNIQAGLRQQSINIPCFSSRVKSILSIPVNANETNYRPNRNGSINSLREFQAQIGTRREPNRPVDMTNTTNAVAFYPSQEYLYELKKVFKSSGVGVRTLQGFRENFAFPRSLSSMGGSEDLSDKGFRFNVEYNADPLAHNVYTFVYHIKRLQVSPQGLVVFS
jgi:hypothetical protein